MDLMSKKTQLNSPRDGVIISRILADVPGGVVLNLEGYKGSKVYAGQPVLIEEVEGKAVYKPLNVITEPTDSKQGELETLAEGAKVLGVILNSRATEEAHVGVMTIGQINKDACYFTITDEVIKAMPRVEFSGNIK